jgi:putative SOS response-associated peptidase YedK
MCGRCTLTPGLAILQRRFGFAAEEITLDPRYNLAPTQEAPVVVYDASRVLRLMQWGLVPSWAKEDSIGNRMINARAETISQKPSFKKSFQLGRCLVLADGFYEWRKVMGSRTKIPMRFVLKSREPFAFAGLWDTWQQPEDEELRSFTIITTEANELLRSVHDRMPVILPQEDEEMWLDSDLKDVDKLTPLLAPYPPDRLQGYDVSTPHSHLEIVEATIS